MSPFLRAVFRFRIRWSSCRRQTVGEMRPREMAKTRELKKGGYGDDIFFLFLRAKIPGLRGDRNKY